MKISNKDIDLGLVKRAKAGDYQAFDLLVLKYQSRLISTAFKFVKDQQIAEDLVQDSFIKSFKSISSFREDSTFYTWIYRITVNTAWTLRKKAKKHNTLNIEETYEPIVIDEKKDPELVAINSDLSSVLVSALDKIPMDQRIIVELKNIEGRSHKEIADILGISVTAAKVRLHRAHQKLRQILEEVER